MEQFVELRRDLLETEGYDGKNLEARRRWNEALRGAGKKIAQRLTISDLKRKFQGKRVQGVGSCLFYSVVAVMSEKNTGYKRAGDKLRKDTANYLRQNASTYQKSIPKGTTVDNFAKDIHSGKYGDTQLEIQLLSDMLDRTIKVYNVNPKIHTGKRVEMTQYGSGTETPIHLFRTNDNHYDPLYLKKEEEEEEEEHGTAREEPPSDDLATLKSLQRRARVTRAAYYDLEDAEDSDERIKNSFYQEMLDLDYRSDALMEKIIKRRHKEDPTMSAPRISASIRERIERHYDKNGARRGVFPRRFYLTMAEVKRARENEAAFNVLEPQDYDKVSVLDRTSEAFWPYYDDLNDGGGPDWFNLQDWTGSKSAIAQTGGGGDPWIRVDQDLIDFVMRNSSKESKTLTIPQIKEMFRGERIDGDGSCLFHSVVVGMEGGVYENYQKDGLKLRARTARYLQQHAREWEMWIPDDKTVEDYANGIATGEYGDEVEVRLLSDMLNLAIEVYDVRPDKQVRLTQYGSAQDSTIHLLRRNNDHFDVLFRRNVVQEEEDDDDDDDDDEDESDGSEDSEESEESEDSEERFGGARYSKPKRDQLDCFVKRVNKLGQDFNPMLAESYGTISDGKLTKKMSKLDVSGWWASEKYDGYRAIWTGSQFISRGGIPLTTPEWMKQLMPSQPLDGELFRGRCNFESCGIFRRADASEKDWENVSYVVFDLPAMDAPFEQRMARLREIVEERCACMAQVRPGVNVKCPLIFAKQTKLRDERQMVEMFEKITRAGGEGIMLRRPGSAYTQRRTRDLLKIKVQHDMECRVIRYKKGEGRNINKLGAYECSLLEDEDKTFFVGTGLKDSDRENPLPIGTIITIKYNEKTKNGIPRHPVFFRVRDTPYTPYTQKPPIKKRTTKPSSYKPKPTSSKTSSKTSRSTTSSPRPRSSSSDLPRSKRCEDQGFDDDGNARKNKYTSRNSPPYPAAICHPSRKRGNDGQMYVTKQSGKAAPRWVKASLKGGGDLQLRLHLYGEVSAQLKDDLTKQVVLEEYSKDDDHDKRCYEKTNDQADRRPILKVKYTPPLSDMREIFRIANQVEAEFNLKLWGLPSCTNKEGKTVYWLKLEVAKKEEDPSIDRSTTVLGTLKSAGGETCETCERCGSKEHQSSRCPHFSNERPDHPDARRPAASINAGHPNAQEILARDKTTVHKQPKDNSCLFHSLAYGLNGLELPTSAYEGQTNYFGPFNAQQLRSDLVSWMKRNKDTVIEKGYTLKKQIEGAENKSFEEYVKKMEKPTEWGGEIEMYAFSKRYGINVHVYEHDKESENFKLLQEYNHDHGPNTNTIYVLYVNGNHYDALELKKDESKEEDQFDGL